MSWRKGLQKLERLTLVVALLSGLSCGVKGEPVPPDKPTAIGRGRPSYKKATEVIKLQKHQNVDDAQDDLRDIKDGESE